MQINWFLFVLVCGVWHVPPSEMLETKLSQTTKPSWVFRPRVNWLIILGCSNKAMFTKMVVQTKLFSQKWLFKQSYVHKDGCSNKAIFRQLIDHWSFFEQPSHANVKKRKTGRRFVYSLLAGFTITYIQDHTSTIWLFNIAMENPL